MPDDRTRTADAPAVTRERETFAPERMLAFSDGVFAVAITLLVLELRPPELGLPASDGALLAALLAMHEKFLIFVISFLVIGVLWLGHHRKFSMIERIDGRLLWLNLLFLLLICLLPFATAVNSLFGNLTAAILYDGTMALASTVSAAISWYALSTPGLARPALRPGVRRDLLLSPLLNAGVFGLSAVLATVSLPLSRYALFLIVPASMFAGARKDR